MARPAGLACALLLAAACADAAGPVGPPVAAPVPHDALQVVSCQADVRAGTAHCRPDEGEEAGGASAARILGGQGVNVRVTSSNVLYDSVAEVFGMDVTVQNLLAQRMGTADGSAVTGVTVFFHSEPSVVGSAGGAVSVRNADGEGFFTGGGQPYFHYPEVLPLNAVSGVRRWEFDCSRAVERFTFLVYVRAELLPVVVFDRYVAGNRDLYRIALDGSDFVRLTTAARDDVNPTVGGGTVVFTSYRTGNPELWSIPLTGGVETRLTTTDAAETDPALSADGTRLAYVSNVQSGIGKVWTATPQGAGAVRATPADFGLSGSPEIGPAWAPSGNHLALVSTANGSADLFDYVMPGIPLLLAGSADYSEVDPAWSPQGDRIVYVSTLTGGGDLYLIHLRTGDVTRLTTREGAESSPTWLSDGRILYQAWETNGTVELRWLHPENPSLTGVVSIPGGGGRPEHPYVVPF